MSAVEHDHAQLGAYVLGVLEPDEAARFEVHLASCPRCRREVAELAELRTGLDEVPPEAFLDGPPEDGDLLLQRTLRAAREPAAAPSRRPWALVAGAAAVLVAAALGAGVLIGRGTVDTNVAGPPPATSTPPGARALTAADPATGARMVATVTPAAGWVRVHVAVEGVREGERCRLVVRSKQGEQVVAGSWVVSAKAEKEGTGLDGSALIPPDQVASVDVVTTDGRKIVSASA
ncbi:anti-sigma factor family protein [Amycolatopsis nigrescens]|uniref:anti-sigma factor family protein n=1 Tax=Amycolatopsis nigrescens TaxID=381445 RepID=UPI000378E523|nr:zf-HC2 domain-containing protein [Amycolatopsis nigrescens]